MKRFINTIFMLVLISSLFGVSPAFALVSPSDKINGKTANEYNISQDLLPNISSPSGILMSSDGRIIWEREADSVRKIAGLNAIMAAIVALESGMNLEDQVTVPPKTAWGTDKTVELSVGDKAAFKDLIAALLVRPVPQTAELVAKHVAESESNFVGLMNAKAEELGLDKTHFANVFGSDNAHNFSSARDMATLSRYAMQNSDFKAAVSTKILRFSVQNSSGAISEKQLINTNALLWKLDSATGVKGGISKEAGYVLSASASQESLSLYAVVLGTDLDVARFRDVQELFDFGFAHYRSQELAIAGTRVGDARVANYVKRTVGAVIKDDLKAPVLDFAGEITRKISLIKAKAPLIKGDEVGVASFYQGDTLIATVPLVATDDVAKPFILLRPFYWIINAVSELFS